MGTLARRITVFGTAAALAFGGAGVAQAKHGSDDPVKAVRGGHGADDAQPHARHSADDAKLSRCLKKARRSHDRSERGRKVARCKRLAKRRADDRRADDRRAADDRRHGADDPAGDDHGGDRPAGTSDDPAGDDHGGHGGDDGAGHR